MNEIRLSVFEQVKLGLSPVSVIGLGYVGLNLALLFSTKLKVIAYDISSDRIDYLRDKYSDLELSGTIVFTNNPSDLSKSVFHIVAVPTPINEDQKPELSHLKDASFVIWRHLTKGSIVVYESTVYPGVTEDICASFLEQGSGYMRGLDFKVAYSPERFNPGDDIHTIKNIAKIVSGIDKATIEAVCNVYGLVIENVIPVSSIRTAEAIKLIENCQRDVNIAFMNEIAIALHSLGISTDEVMRGMDTKWNALGFRPGLVGGHCIAVDPYYMIELAKNYGFDASLLQITRRINNEMANYVVAVILRLLAENDCVPNKSKITIFGFAFKENCTDIRNTQVFPIIKQLQNAGVQVVVYDPVVDYDIAKMMYSINLADTVEMYANDCVVFAVAHKQFTQMAKQDIDKLYKPNNKKKLLIDIKGIFPKTLFNDDIYQYWAL